MNNLVSSNPFKTYIGTIRVRKKTLMVSNSSTDDLVPVGFFKKTTKPTQSLRWKKKILPKKKLFHLPSPENETLPTKLSKPNLQFAVEVFWEDWRHIALPPSWWEVSSPLPPLDGRSKNSYAGGEGGWYCDSGEGDVLKKRISHGKLQTLPNPDAPCVLFFLATFGNFLW